MPFRFVTCKSYELLKMVRFLPTLYSISIFFLFPGGIRTCRPLDFQCDDGSCIPHEYVCDGYGNCPNNTDELHCVPGMCLLLFCITTAHIPPSVQKWSCNTVVILWSYYHWLS